MCQLGERMLSDLNAIEFVDGKTQLINTKEQYLHEEISKSVPTRKWLKENNKEITETYTRDLSKIAQENNKFLFTNVTKTLILHGGNREQKTYVDANTLLELAVVFCLQFW